MLKLNSEYGQIYQGNALDILRQLPDESVHCCVTSPPYWGLRDYGNDAQIWDGEHGEYFNNESWQCVHEWGEESLSSLDKRTPEELAKKSKLNRHKDPNKSHVFLPNSGDISRGQFCQKCGAWRGSLGLEPTPELFIKHMVEIFAEVKRVLRNDGTLWLNMGDSYAAGGNNKAHTGSYGVAGSQGECLTTRGIPPGLKPKDLCGIPWMLAFALRADGWYLRSDIIWHKPNPMPESVTDRPTKAHEYMFLLTKSAKYYYDADAIRENFADERMGASGVRC